MDTLVFTVEGRRFGLPAEDVREIARLDVLRPLPHPIVDMRAALGMPARGARRGDLLVVVAVGRARVALRVDGAAGFAADDGDALPADVVLFPDVAALVPAEHLMAPRPPKRSTPWASVTALLASLTLHLVPRFR